MSHPGTPPSADPLAGLAVPAAEIPVRFALIYRTMLAESGQIREPQFRAIDTDDLERLFRLYDRHFFGGRLAALLEQVGAQPVRFRLSNRMTRAAGKTEYRRVRRRVGWRVVEQAECEIAVSTFLLFEAFRADLAPEAVTRPVEVAGVACADRLEALLRIFEHELLHLAEFLAHGKSSCAAEPFRRLSRALFGHEASHHTLITPVERAATVHAIRPGDRVTFTHGGVERAGLVNRITKRATVLVPDPSGRLFADGRRYASYFVPLPLLRKVDPGPAEPTS